MNVVQQLAARWALTLDAPFPPTPGSPGNFVAPATLPDGAPAVLKVSRFVAETRQEIAALRFWDGIGAARLIDADPELGALLLERVLPGSMLADVDDAAAIRVTADLLTRLWRPVSALDGLRPLPSWLAAYDRNRMALERGDGGFPTPLFQRADALRRELLETTNDAVVLHGDLHHFNVLRSDRAHWLAIDPKGLVGDRCFDVCQFLVNPGRMAATVNRRRLDQFSALLGLDRRRLAQWAFVHAVLDACWDFEDGQDWRRTVAYAEETLSY